MTLKFRLFTRTRPSGQLYCDTKILPTYRDFKKPHNGNCKNLYLDNSNITYIMKKKFLIFFGLLFTYVSAIHAQTSCNHEHIILSFLQKISSVQYKSSLKDFESFFDSECELEFGLRDTYIMEHPKTKLTFETDSLSLAINRVLNNKTVRHLIDLKNNRKGKWIIEESDKEGSATIVYKIGVTGSNRFIYMQMTNWAYKKRCGIIDIRDSIGNTIFAINKPD